MQILRHYHSLGHCSYKQAVRPVHTSVTDSWRRKYSCHRHNIMINKQRLKIDTSYKKQNNRSSVQRHTNISNNQETNFKNDPRMHSIRLESNCSPIFASQRFMIHSAFLQCCKRAEWIVNLW